MSLPAAAALTGAAGFADTAGLFALTELADDGLQRSLLPDRTAGLVTADADDVDDLLQVSTFACDTESSVALLTVSSTDWSALTNVACLTGAVGRSFLLAAAVGWLADEGREFDAVDLQLATESLRARTASGRRFTTTLDCVVVVGGFFGAADCPACFTRDVVQDTVVVDADVTRLGAFWAVFLLTDECLLVTGLTTAGLFEAVSALLGLLAAGTSEVTDLGLTALDERVAV